MVHKINMKKDLVSIFLIGAILVSFGLGTLFGRASIECPFCPPEDLDFSLFWEAWHNLEDRFVDPDKLDAQEMTYGAISGMIEALDDPYTTFLDPDKSKIFSEDISGQFEGVGMEIGIRKSQLQVIAPLEGTPAQKAGLRSGDKIVEIDGESSLDITIEEAVSLIRGPKGTDVVLTIYREEWTETREVTITRAVIKIPSLSWELKEGDIAYIKIYHFSQNASYDFRSIAIDILNSSAKRIIIDLRNNPGGYLEIAQDITSWFLEMNDVIAIEDFGDKQEAQEYKSNRAGLFSEYPIVCLINAGTASGSEILVGALRDNRGVIVIGERSFGKGSVQELVKLKGGSSLKITIARWLTPKGELITDVGIEPDIEVEMTSEDFEADRDPQLDKAIEVVKGL